MDDIRTRPLSAIDGPAALLRALPHALLLAYALVGLLIFLAVPFLAQYWISNLTPAEAPGMAAFLLPYLTGLVYLAMGVWVFATRRAYAPGRVFSFFAISAALTAGLWFDFSTARFLPALWTTAAGLCAAALAAMAFSFPREEDLTGARGWLIPGLVTGGLALGMGALMFLTQHADPYLVAGVLWSANAAAALFLTLRWLRRRISSSGPNEREMLRLPLIAAAACFAAAALLWAAGPLLGPGSAGSMPLAFIPLALFPLVSGYTVQRHHMLQTDIVLSMGMRYGLLSVLVAVGYALIVAGLGLGTVNAFSPRNPAVTGLIFFVLAMALQPAREAVQRMVDALFFRNHRVYQDRLQTFSGELTRVVDLPSILRVLRRYVDEALAPSRLHIFVYDPLSDQYAAAPAENGRPTSDLRFPIISGLAIRLGEQHSGSTQPLLLTEFDAMPPALEPDRTRLALLGAELFVPLPGRQRLSGWLALGPRRSGEPYTPMQLSFAEALCDQAALAIERAQVVGNMENRVREMNVLTRVAQGINITLRLDDILELVYAQTTQILPAGFFAIMLYDRSLDAYQYPFYLEGDDRDVVRENRPVPPGQALEQEVIRQRRAIRTEDHARECQRRGILRPADLRPDIIAWMGVPLNAGAETIGALSLGSSDPAVEYTPEQQALLQAIADQVAGALVKARLLSETERRARQLTTLNEVTRQLTSTLESEPLLQSILQSAVDILNCEAGSLLLVDEAADELVFRSVVGPAAPTLLLKRMPTGRGVVGKSVRTGQPIIVNDVTRFPEWFADPDKTTGFVTRAVLVVPLIVKERVFGVIEVINKRDGTIFSEDDQDLLSAFASQAAVAIENARLYTNTDQALSARVEELSVMQRIDRELNASLDTSRAMRITLEWAMRQSGAQAGLVGVLAPDSDGDDIPGVRVMASQGYTTELEPFENQVLPSGLFHLEEVIAGGLPVRRAQGDENGLPALLDGGTSQAIIPIRRETNTIGVLLLESAAGWKNGASGWRSASVSSLEGQTLSDEAMNFLIRLSDHASIAISNAQLYAEVQQANLAKSDFVSFVAHELKNPMTSVKGYTELIAAGAVGPVNESQANFLGTIRANIERMNTLVSDLNDMSKIEVGRLRLDFKSLRLADSIQTVERSTRKQVEEKQQVLAINLPADLPALWADRVRLEQVLVNLVSNAHKYTPTGGQIEVAAERCKNEWDPNGAAEVVHIWVRDNGIGINEEDQKKIFQKFFRSDDPKTREVPGTGLGLNITRSLVEMQGGRIWFESEFRKGTTFHFTVPVSEN